MAKIKTITVAFLLIVAMAALPPLELTAAPVAAPSPLDKSPDANCFSYLVNAGDCLSFVENGSKLHKPDHNCCPELTNLTAMHPACLCELLFNSSQFGFSIDANKALKLPSLCNIATPISLCADLGVPVPSPVAVSPPPELSTAPVATPSPSNSSPGANCFSYLADVGDCLTFVENGSKLHKPDNNCCPELINLTAMHPVCLCELLFNSSQFDFSIDTKKAIKLPSLCNIAAPVSLCADLGVPVPSPPAVVASPPPELSTAPVVASSPSNGSPSANCLAYLADASDCLTFVENGSKLHKPDHNCCPELTNLTATHPLCLCELLFNSSQFDFSIDTNKALQLPSLCNISAPVSLCADLGVPVPSPPAAKGPSGNHEDNGSPTIALLASYHHFIIRLLLLYFTYLLI